MNDVQWGAMVRLGQTIGIDDSEVLASLTAEDLDLFFNEFVDKEGIADPAIKQFLDTDSFWKTVFKTDEKGEFLKEDGKAVRNTDFEFVTINKPQPNIKVTSNADIVTHSGSYKFNFEADYSTELTAMSPETLLRWGDAINQKNLNMKGLALSGSLSGEKGVWKPELAEGESLESFYKKELGFYMLQTSTNFNKPFMKTAHKHFTIDKFRFTNED